MERCCCKKKRNKQSGKIEISSAISETISPDEIANTQVSPHHFKFIYDANGKLLLDDKELYANSAELLFAISGGENVEIDVEFTEIEEKDRLLGKINDANPSPDQRIMRIEVMKNRRFLVDQIQLLIRGLEVAFHDPILPFLYMDSRRLGYISRGLGKLLFRKSVRTGQNIHIFLDLWLKENSGIGTSVAVDLAEETERKHYEELIGPGWDLYRVPEESRYEFAIPAIILEYLRLLDEGELENPEILLDLYRWNVGFG